MKISNELKQAALEAGKEAAKRAAEKSKAKAGLMWWERLLWIVLAGLAGAACSVLTGCGQWYAWEEMTPEQRAAFQAADRAYHQWSGEPAPGCVAIAKGDK